MNPSQMAYRKTAVEGASGFGLLIGLYDTLAGDLRRAADAERNNDIEKRCREVNHAFVVIGYLEDRISRGDGGELADKLTSFYRSMRRNLILAQTKRSAEMLEQQMEDVLKIREIWQNSELRPSPALEALSQVEGQSHPGTSLQKERHVASSWSA
jgi:flagellar biosynthetic protein FliS